MIAQLRVALSGNISRFVSCLRIGGYVNSTPGFLLQSQVIDGASDLIGEVFGDRGRHSRIAIGVSALPYDVAVEVEATFQIRALGGSGSGAHEH